MTSKYKSKKWARWKNDENIYVHIKNDTDEPLWKTPIERFWKWTGTLTKKFLTGERTVGELCHQWNQSENQSFASRRESENIFSIQKNLRYHSLLFVQSNILSRSDITDVAASMLTSWRAAIVVFHINRCFSRWSSHLKHARSCQ